MRLGNTECNSTRPALIYLYFYWENSSGIELAARAGRYPAMCFKDSCGRWSAPRQHRRGFEWPMAWCVQFVHRADECRETRGLINMAVIDGAAAGVRAPASSTTAITRAPRSSQNILLTTSAGCHYPRANAAPAGHSLYLRQNQTYHNTHEFHLVLESWWCIVTETVTMKLYILYCILSSYTALTYLLGWSWGFLDHNIWGAKQGRCQDFCSGR